MPALEELGAKHWTASAERGAKHCSITIYNTDLLNTVAEGFEHSMRPS